MKGRGPIAYSEVRVREIPKVQPAAHSRTQHFAYAKTQNLELSRLAFGGLAAEPSSAPTKPPRSGVETSLGQG